MQKLLSTEGLPLVPAEGLPLVPTTFHPVLLPWDKSASYQHQRWGRCGSRCSGVLGTSAARVLISGRQPQSEEVGMEPAGLSYKDWGSSNSCLLNCRPAYQSSCVLSKHILTGGVCLKLTTLWGPLWETNGCIFVLITSGPRSNCCQVTENVATSSWLTYSLSVVSNGFHGKPQNCVLSCSWCIHAFQSRTTAARLLPLTCLIHIHWIH